MKGDWTHLSNKDIENTELQEHYIFHIDNETVRNENNFHSFCNDGIQRKLCLQSLDSQEHCIECPKILEKVKYLNKHISYEHVYGNVQEQK